MHQKHKTNYYNRK